MVDVVYINLYQMHHIDRTTPWEEVWQEAWTNTLGVNLIGAANVTSQASHNCCEFIHHFPFF